MNVLAAMLVAGLFAWVLTQLGLLAVVAHLAAIFEANTSEAPLLTHCEGTESPLRHAA